MAKILANYGGLLAAAMGQTLLLALCGLFFACIIGLIVGAVKSKGFKEVPEAFKHLEV